MPRIAVNGSGVDPELNAEIAAALRGAGAHPERLPLDEQPRLGTVDAVVFVGGDDIDPARFGSERHATHVPLEPGREAFDFALLELALAERLPILAICLGAQELWVAQGGALIQDIPSETGSKVDHRAKQLGTRVELLPGSRLADAYGSDRVDVYCNHHQGFAEAAAPSGIVITARSRDGLIEGFETTDPKHFVVAVGFHPERPPLGTGLFAALVDAARAAHR